MQKLGLAVYGVSYDNPNTNRDFAEKNKLPYLLLSDTDRSLARAVGAGRALLPLPKRVSYLVGEEGRVLKSYPKVDPKTHASKVLADFLATIAVD